MWEASILCGFVNGMDPLVPGAGPDGEDVDLVDDPSIPLRGFRSLPGEAEPIPPFFAALGARGPGENIVFNNDTGAFIVEEEDPEQLPPRLLVAMDFYLATARATFSSGAVEADASGASGLVVDFFTTYNTDNLNRVGSRSRLMQAPKMPEKVPPDLSQRLMGNFSDDGEDRQLISTVYFLSQPGATVPVPDSTWLPFVKHAKGGFWNLSHSPRNNPVNIQIPPIRLHTGLAFGLGDALINGALAVGTAFADMVLNAILNTSTEGKYWTS